MLSEDRYFHDLTEEELWQRYCGFLGLSIEEFMDIQNELLIDQIERVANSTLGRKIMGNQKPKSVKEFRSIVPLTTYDDYEPYLNERQEDALAIKPQLWTHSSGRGGQFKWFPFGEEYIDKAVKCGLATLILASSNRRGEVNVSPGFRVLAVAPPPPYASGSLFQVVAERISLRRIPPPEDVENLGIRDSLRLGFQVALREGVDAIFSLASILVKMGEELSGQARTTRLSPAMLHPKIVSRLVAAWLRSKREKRPLLPKDLWPTKAIMTTGLDTTIYKDDITHYWGSQPYDFYGCTESFFTAAQTWNRKWMVFFPDLLFLEFIPEGTQAHPDNEASTVLLDELEEGKSYEVVITQFYGLPLLRYRMKDIIKVIALKDAETGINLPHIVFQRRVGETIDLAGLARLDEKTIWQAIANTGIHYTDWIACKEYEGGQTYLRLYLELKGERGDKDPARIAAMVDEQLRIVDTDYKDIDAYLKLQPVRVTLLSPGTFQRYTDEKVREGASLAHLKPIHINAPEAIIQRILQLSEVKEEKS